MSKKVIGLVSFVGIAGMAAFMGCSAATTVTATDAGPAATTDSGKLVGDSGKTDSGSSSSADTGPATCYDEKGAIKIPAATGKAGQNVCNTAQITGFYTACLDAKATVATCEAYSKVPANAACLGCIEGYFPDGGISPHYPVLLPGDAEEETVYANDVTCGYLLIKKPECVQRAVDSFVCVVSACSTCGDADFDACIEEAEKGICKDVVETKACVDAYAAAETQIDAVCGGADFDTAYNKVAAFLCGPPRDGG